MKFFSLYLKQRRLQIGIFLFFLGIFLVAFCLYHLPVEAVLYPAFVCALFGILVLVLDVRRAYRKHSQLQALQAFSASVMESLPSVATQDDRDYQEIIRGLQEEKKQLENRMHKSYSEMVDYYTLWAHQIKTPIASMRLTLQNEDSELSRKVSEDLFRIEQYVEMVLCYLRLDSDSTDYVIRQLDLDNLIRQAVRRFSGQFINKKIRLEYKAVNAQVVSDEKWLQFVVEQVLSNAVKYTPSGGTVTIGLESPKTLCISDTGIGIAAEDLPRVFERGYTGFNGRGDKKASGIGLYLCRRICKNLGHRITANSSPDSGTVIRIYLDQKKLEVE